MTKNWILRSLAAAAAFFSLGSVALHAESTEPGATVEADVLESSDIRLGEVSVQADQDASHDQYELSATQDRIDIDYSPAKFDFVSQPVHRIENSTDLSLTSRFETDSNFSPMVVVGGYRGFTDYRSVWLDEFYRQYFEDVPGYVHVLPHGWNAMAGGRWTYVPERRSSRSLFCTRPTLCLPVTNRRSAGPF